MYSKPPSLYTSIASASLIRLYPQHRCYPWGICYTAAKDVPQSAFKCTTNVPIASTNSPYSSVLIGLQAHSPPRSRSSMQERSTRTVAHTPADAVRTRTTHISHAGAEEDSCAAEAQDSRRPPQRTPAMSSIFIGRRWVKHVAVPTLYTSNPVKHSLHVQYSFKERTVVFRGR